MVIEADGSGCSHHIRSRLAYIELRLKLRSGAEVWTVESARSLIAWDHTIEGRKEDLAVQEDEEGQVLRDFEQVNGIDQTLPW